MCDLDVEQVREHRGTLRTLGHNSPFRNRTIAETRLVLASILAPLTAAAAIRIALN